MNDPKKTVHVGTSVVGNLTARRSNHLMEPSADYTAT